MTNPESRFLPGASWLRRGTTEEHQILTIEEDGVVTISPPESYSIATVPELKQEVTSWYGTIEAFHEEFCPPAAA